MDENLPKKFVLEAQEAESIRQDLNLPSVPHLLPRLVQSAQSLARPPISNFHVGAVGLGSDGRVFIGVNLEFPGLPLHHSVHAEQFLLTNLAVHGCTQLLSFAVSDAPCGHCRQFLQELRNSSSLKILVTSHVQGNVENYHSFKTLSEILPNPFGPHDLLGKEIPLLLEPHNNGLSLLLENALYMDRNSTDLCNGNCELSAGNKNCVKLRNGNWEKNENDGILLRRAALEAANKAHAPYSGCPSGVALMDSEGKVYKGSYMESAAYNPSLGPVQAALVAYLSGGGVGYNSIVAAALVEKEEAKVKQEDTARLILKAVSPRCEFTVFYCRSPENGCENRCYLNCCRQMIKLLGSKVSTQLIHPITEGLKVELQVCNPTASYTGTLMKDVNRRMSLKWCNVDGLSFNSACQGLFHFLGIESLSDSCERG